MEARCEPKPTRFTRAFIRAQAAQRLLFFPELLPHYPSLDTSRHALDWVAEHDHIALKLPTPVSTGYPTNVGDVIRNAHREACVQGATLSSTLEAFARYPQHPRFLIVYPHAWSKLPISPTCAPTLHAFVERVAPHTDALLFVQDLPHLPTLSPTGIPSLLASLYEHTQHHALDLVRIVYTGSEHTPEFAARVLSSQGFIYLALGPTPGRPRHGMVEIRHSLEYIASLRPTLPVLAGFGLRSPQDITPLHTLPNLQGVTLGTALYQALARGHASFQTTFTQLHRACQRSNTPT